MSKKLSISILGTRGIPARYGGFETFAEELSARLVKNGHSVSVYGRHALGTKKPRSDIYQGVERRSAATIMHKYLETPLAALFSFIDLFFRKVDVVILCNAAASPFAFLAKARLKPLFINVDGIERKRSKWNALGRAWYWLGERCSVLLASRVIADAEVISEYYAEQYSCKTTVIPYGVHPVVRPPGVTLGKFELQPKRYILYVSRLEPENNALGVIQAYVKSGLDMPLVIVGDAPYADEYKAKLRAAANQNVLFTGFQFGESYQELQSNCYAYIQATEVGGTHPALIESMSYGNCVIANGTPENIEVVGDTALVYRMNDFDHLAELMKRVASDQGLVEVFGARAKERAIAQYSWERVVALYEELFTQFS